MERMFNNPIVQNVRNAGVLERQINANTLPLKTERGENINRIAVKLQEKDQKSKNQDFSEEEDRSSQDQQQELRARQFGDRALQQVYNLERIRQLHHPPDFASRGRFIGYPPIPNNRKRSEEDYPLGRPDSPNMHPMSMHPRISQSFSPDHPSEYEEGPKKRKRYEDEASELEDLEQFAKDFKQKRIKMGFTQGDVGVAMGKFYGNDFSQTTISRFEALNLSVKNMCKLKPLLERWLVDVDRAISSGDRGEGRLALSQPMIPVHPQQCHGRKRKKRTSIPTEGRSRLEDAFHKNPKPTSEEICKFSEDLKMDREVIRVWFCNRRQKQKRITIQQQQYMGDDSSSPVSPQGYSGPPAGEGQRSPMSSEDEAYHGSRQTNVHSSYANEPQIDSYARREVALAARSAVNADNIPAAVSAVEAPILRISPGETQLPPRPNIIQPRLQGVYSSHLRPASFSPHAGLAMRGESTT